MSTEPESFYAIRRTDNELLFGEYGWVGTSGPTDWAPAEDDAADNGCPATYELVEMTVKMVRIRTLPMCVENCDHVAEFWGLCEQHAREDDPDYFAEVTA